jgi:hypothetical protein
MLLPSKEKSMRFWFPSDTNTQHFVDECSSQGVEVEFDRAIFVNVEADHDTLHGLAEKARELGGVIEEVE